MTVPRNQGFLRDGVLGWGKHKGQHIADIPADYLEWLIESSRATIAQLEAELDRRAMAEQASLPWAEKIVQAGFKELAKRVHPDVGGNTATMTELNNAREALLELARRERQP